MLWTKGIVAMSQELENKRNLIKKEILWRVNRKALILELGIIK